LDENFVYERFKFSLSEIFILSLFFCFFVLLEVNDEDDSFFLRILLEFMIIFCFDNGDLCPFLGVMLDGNIIDDEFELFSCSATRYSDKSLSNLELK
jgi:hypothetical protein